MDRWRVWSAAVGVLALCASGLSTAEPLPVRAFGAADGLRGVYVHQIRSDPAGFVWLLSPDGLARFDGSSFVNYGSEDGLAGQIVTDFAFGSDETRLVSTVPGGVYEMGDRERGQILQRLPLPELPTILQMMPGPAGTFLCATKHGLLSLSRQGARWQTRPLNPGAASHGPRHRHRRRGLGRRRHRWAQPAEGRRGADALDEKRWPSG